MPAADWKEKARARRRSGGGLRRFFTDLGLWAPVLLILGVFFFSGAGAIGGAAAAAVASGAGAGNGGMHGSPLVGIDLGTTYSVAAVWRNGQVEVVPNPLGNRITPSVVSWREGERLVGDAALAEAAHNPRGTVTAVKRLMGQHWTNPSVQADAALVGYNVTAGREGRATVQVAVGDKTQEFSPEEISAMVLGELKASTEAYLGEAVTQAVITVPAYFSDAQRQATKIAGQIAGLEVTRVINEPTAAALAYGLDKKGDEQKILVFDLGGGTLDVSLLTIDEGFFEVVATHGDTHLGGEDFDARLVRHVLRQVKEKKGRDLSRDADAVAAIRRAAESAKRRLSSGLEAVIELESLELSETITRAKFEAINSDLFRSCLTPVRKVLSDAGLTVEGIDQVVLVGGSTRIPKIRSMLADTFGADKLNFNIHPDEAIAYGAAVMAASVRAGKKGNSEADLPEVLLVDVAPLTLGVETVGGQMSPILPRNTPVPESKKRVFTTVKDNQAVVRVNVYEGERALVKDNRLLGTFDLTIPPVPRGVPQIEVEFLVDKNNMLSVTARDLFCTPNDANPRCVANLVVPSDSLRLNKDEVDALVAEAQASAESDRAATAHIDRRHELEQLAFSLQTAAADAEGVSMHLSSTDRNELRNSAREALQWLDSNPAGEMSECVGHIESLRLAAASLRPEEGVEEMDTI